MGGVVLLSMLLYFAATIYASVILIQLGGWLTILSGLLLICSYFILSALSLVGAATLIKRSKGERKETDIS